MMVLSVLLNNIDQSLLALDLEIANIKVNNYIKWFPAAQFLKFLC